MTFPIQGIAQWRNTDNIANKPSPKVETIPIADTEAWTVYGNAPDFVRSTAQADGRKTDVSHATNDENEAVNLTDADYEALRALDATLSAYPGWDDRWDFADNNMVTNTQGLTVREGRIVGLDLSGLGLTGSFPWAVFALGALEELNLSENNLSGDIGTGMIGTALANPTAGAALTSIDISNNKLSGNIGLFAKFCPALTTLYANGNGITDVVPMISPNVTDLKIWGQVMEDKVVDIDLSDLSIEALLPQIPTIILYDHANQTYKQTLDVLGTPGKWPDNVNIWENFWLSIKYADGDFSMFYNSTAPVYYGESGDTLCILTSEDSQYYGDYVFYSRLFFDAGDVNFTGTIDVYDLQTLIQSIFDEYEWLFNYTAADVIADNALNVQDVVGEVNILLSQSQPSPMPANRPKAVASNGANGAEASVYVSNGRLTVNTTKPVAAFDIWVDGTAQLDIAGAMTELGMTCVTKAYADGVRIIGYSLNGGCIPAGETTVAEAADGNAYVKAVMLSDKEAGRISAVANAVTTSIGATTYGQPTISLADGKIAFDTSGMDGDAQWTATTADGRLIGQGTIRGGSGVSYAGINAAGVIIVNLKAGNTNITKKLINDK